MAVPVGPGPVFTPGIPQPLFSLAGYRGASNRQEYDVAPDDRHFIMIRDLRGSAQSEVIYAENWLPELVAKVKR